MLLRIFLLRLKLSIVSMNRHIQKHRYHGNNETSVEFQLMELNKVLNSGKNIPVNCPNVTKDRIHKNVNVKRVPHKFLKPIVEISQTYFTMATTFTGEYYR